LPDGPIEIDGATSLYPRSAPPVFFGHYKRRGVPSEPDASNVMCFDYPKAPCAYRWSGDAALNVEGLHIVE
jgi:hypothetical protein